MRFGLLSKAKVDAKRPVFRLVLVPVNLSLQSSVRDRRPRFSLREAQRIAQERFGITAQAAELPSERDQNFRLETDSGELFVLKFSQSMEDPSVLDFQCRVLEHVASRAENVAVPQVRPSLNDLPIEIVRSDAGQEHHCRLLTYLPGIPLAQVKPHSPQLLRELGVSLGQLDRALLDFQHPAMLRPLQWDLQHAFAVFDQYAVEIDTTSQTELFQRYVRRFTESTAGKLAGLRCSVVQNDANDYNVLVKSDLDGQHVTGLLDFGDMIHTYTVAEVAIACAYAMQNKDDPLASATAIVAGYHQELPLNAEEVAVLFDLICMRLCMSVAISAHQKKQEPDNDYLAISETPTWDLLRQLTEIHPDFAETVFRHACGMTPCPRFAAVTRWLVDKQADVRQVLDADLNCVYVHDLSVGSTDLPASLLLEDAQTFEKTMSEERRRHGAEVGIGRYDEPRLCYQAEHYRCESDGAPRRRTIHLGIDLFAPSGSPVYAPLDGAVHSFADNRLPLDYGPTIVVRHETEEGVGFYTLYGHLSRESLEGIKVGQPIRGGQQIGTIGDLSVNGGWPAHVHFQIITNMLGREGDFPGVAPPDQREEWLSLCPDPNLILGIRDVQLRLEHFSQSQMLDTRRQRLGPSLSVSYRRPLTIVRGFRQYLYDDLGREYLDAVNNVPHVGHCHPHVVSAGQRQMAVLNTNTRYLHENLVRYADRLAAKFPASLDVCFFVCSGSEANELALRLARTYTGGTDFVVLEAGYHGNTSGLVDISSYKFDGPGGAGLPHYVQKAIMPDAYRGPYKLGDPSAGAKYAESVREALQRIEKDGRKPAAFVAESILSCGGQIVPPDGYFQEAYAHVRTAGGLCIADEVQTGFGRVGSHFWAFEMQGVVPDIVTLGKPIGNGHPMGAVVTRREIAESFANGMEYFNTFGGNPVSCAIGLAVLDVIEQEGLQENAQRTGSLFLQLLREIKQRHSLVGDVRGSGLFLGIEFVLDHNTLQPAPRHASYVVERMKECGILVSTDGPFHNVIKIKPPMVFGEDDVRRFCATLDCILAESALHS